MDDVALPRGRSCAFHDLHGVTSILAANASRYAATVDKIIKEYLPKDVRLGPSTLDLLLQCCGGEDSCSCQYMALSSGTSINFQHFRIYITNVRLQA